MLPGARQHSDPDTEVAMPRWQLGPDRNLPSVQSRRAVARRLLQPPELLLVDGFERWQLWTEHCRVSHQAVRVDW